MMFGMYKGKSSSMERFFESCGDVEVILQRDAGGRGFYISQGKTLVVVPEWLNAAMKAFPQAKVVPWTNVVE